VLKKKLLLISIVTIFLIAVFHYIAIKYSWYWTYRWLDIPVHIFGGFWISLTVLWVCLKIKHIDSILGYKKKALFVVLASVLAIAVLWEIFELIFKITSLSRADYWSDSLGDIANTFLGGLIALLYFVKNKKSAPKLVDHNLVNLNIKKL
jgi:hypothetical protein